jgi:dolichol kinase
VLLGVVLALVIYFGIVDLFILIAVLTIGLIVSWISRKHKIPVINWFLEQFERERYRRYMPGKGAIYFFIGAIIVYGLFITQPDGRSIVAASIMILALGDAAPHFAAHMGRVKYPFNSLKYVEASLVGVIMAFLGAVWFVGPLEALLASFAAMFVESIDLKIGIEIDDNIIVPVVAGAMIWFLRILI